MKLLKIMALFLLLTSCSGNRRCDPRYDTGAGDTFLCTVNGGFTKKQTETEKILAQARLNNTELTTSKEEIAIQTKFQQEELMRIEKQLNDSAADLSVLDKEAGDYERQKRQLKKQISQIYRDIKAMENSNITEDKKRQKLEHLKKRVEELEDAL